MQGCDYVLFCWVQSHCCCGFCCWQLRWKCPLLTTIPTPAWAPHPLSTISHVAGTLCSIFAILLIRAFSFDDSCWTSVFDAFSVAGSCTELAFLPGFIRSEESFLLNVTFWCIVKGLGTLGVPSSAPLPSQEHQ